MGIQIVHSKRVTQPNNPAYPVSATAWNALHSIVMDTGFLMGRTSVGQGAVEQINVGDGLTLAGGVLSNTNPEPVLLQVQHFETGDMATGSTGIPFDNTKPQNTEGDQYMSLAITPKSATSKLEVEVQWTGGLNCTVTSNLIMAVFRDSGADAVATAWSRGDTSGNNVQFLHLSHTEDSGSKDETTFYVRVGYQLPLAAGGTGAITMNGWNGAQSFGGSMISYITIREYAA